MYKRQVLAFGTDSPVVDVNSMDVLYLSLIHIWLMRCRARPRRSPNTAPWPGSTRSTSRLLTFPKLARNSSKAL